jgi:hypothetical protein
MGQITALTVGAAGLTAVKVLQLGADPLTDGAEGLDIGALGDETAEALGDSGEDEPATNCVGGESFTAGTKVLLASGAAVPIASLAPGAKVLATNVKTGKTSAETVRAVMVKQDTDRYNLTIEVEHRPAVIDTTRNHLFYDLTRRQWMKASQLGHGDRLRGAHGESSVVVDGYAPNSHDGWMWDLSVPGGGDHDFYVDTIAAAVLVHNCPMPGGGSAKVSEVFKTKLGSIMRAPLPSGSPSWSDIGDITMDEVRAAARANQPGFKTILKLLTDSRFNR